ncbi:LysR family transcriptional regulator [Burkholderia plantarii]|nr:LysR family transcriptional regulator [Burkholderia plantarii]
MTILSDRSTPRMNTAAWSEAQTFLSVADAGGFGAAARELGVTQSTISRRVAVLEARLGVRLIERTTRRVALTEAGLAYAAELREILLRLEQADARVQQGAPEPEGTLRVTMPTGYGRARVLPCVTRLARRYPRLRFEVDLSDRYVDLLDSGYDVAIRAASTPQSGVIEQRIASVGILLCGSPAYVAEHGHVARPDQLITHDCLALRTYAPRTSWRVTWRGEPAEAAIAPKMLVSDVFALRDFCAAGLGLAVLPMYAADTALADGSLVNAAPELRWADLDIYAAHARDRASLPKVRVLMDALLHPEDAAAP